MGEFLSNPTSIYDQPIAKLDKNILRGHQRA